MGVKFLLYEIYLAFLEAPLYHLAIEGVLLVWVIWLLMRKPVRKYQRVKLTEKEEEELISDWQPEPLVPEVPENHPALDPFVVDGKVGKYVSINGTECLNLATHNYLGFIEEKDLEESAVQCIRKYGVGSCGPRGFYGTVDVHLNLEARLAKFMNLEEAVLYSYGFSTIASAIPAYAKRGDVIFVDESVNFAIQKGLQASRSDIRYFKHNDMNDLERLVKNQMDYEAKNPKKAKTIRKFVVVEGIYMKTGDIVPLPEIVQMKSKYKLRIFIDESISFGALGQCGRGVTEHYGIPADHVDMIMASLEYSIGSIGGFCVGSSYVVDHQRLSGLGYCFSASLPPMLAAAAITAVDKMEQNPDLFFELRDNCRKLHLALATIPHFRLEGDRDSPIKHLRLEKSSGCTKHDSLLLRNISKEATKRGVAIVAAAYLEDCEENMLPPSLRIVANRLLTDADIQKAITVLTAACDSCIS